MKHLGHDTEGHPMHEVEPELDTLMWLLPTATGLVAGALLALHFVPLPLPL